MGSVTLPQGPEKHCGTDSYHEKHSLACCDEGHWCSGVPVLPPFLELSIRVPLEVAFPGETQGMSQEVALRLVQYYGLGEAIMNNVDNPEVQSTLRVRAGGKDQFYPVRSRDV
jgi:hypothetical protein